MSMMMIDRSHGLLLLNTAILVAASGCAVPKQTRFQMQFVPPARVPASEVTITAEPPPLPPNVYLSAATPDFILDQDRRIPVPTPSDLSMVKADEAYQRGRRSYQAGDKERARKQFDRSIDLLFEASENPTNRQAFERKFEETVEAINRY